MEISRLGTIYYALDILICKFLVTSLSVSDSGYLIKEMYSLVLHYRVHSEVSSERKPKKRTLCTMERTPGMVGNESYGRHH